MTLEVQYVPTEYVAQTWPFVEDHLKDAVGYSNDDYTLDQVRLYLNLGHWDLLVAVDDGKHVVGAGAINFSQSANHRTAFIALMGGKFIINKDLFGKMCEFLKQKGATRVQAQVRPSMERLTRRVGFNNVSTLVEVKL